jgi:hypothetical protein
MHKKEVFFLGTGLPITKSGYGIAVTLLLFQTVE